MYVKDARLGLNFCLLSASSFDFPHAIQDFLSHIALGLKFGEGLAG